MAKGERRRFHKFTASDEQNALLRAEASRRKLPEHRVFGKVVELVFATYFDDAGRDAAEKVDIALRLAEVAAADARRTRDTGTAVLAATVWATDVGLAFLRAGFNDLGIVRKGASYARSAAGTVNGAAYGDLLGSGGLWAPPAPGESRLRIAELTGLTEKQVSRGVAELRQLNIIAPATRKAEDGARHTGRSCFGRVAIYRFARNAWQLVEDGFKSCEQQVGEGKE